MTETVQSLTVSLARHGESECSARRLFCGAGCDAQLTEAGRAQAESLAQRFGNGACDAVYASPLQRAVATATPLAARLGLSVRIDQDWREIDYGAWDGMTEAEARENATDTFERFRATPSVTNPPAGETLTDVADRATAAFARLCRRHVQGRIWIVSHKTTLRALLCRLLDIDLDQYRRRFAMPEGAVSIVRVSGEAGVQLIAHGITDDLLVSAEH